MSKTTTFPPPGGAHDLGFPQGIYSNPSNFNPVTRPCNVMKIDAKATTIMKMDPGTMRNPITAKVDSCNASHAKCLVFQTWHPDSNPTITRTKTWKQAWRNQTCLVQCPQQLSKWNPQNHKKKNEKSSSLDFKVSFFVLPRVPGSSQCLPGAEVEATSMPN